MSAASAKAYEMIKAMIQQGDVLPGERLKETNLTAACGVSRTPVREALRRLASEGLVLFTPNQGAQVASIEGDELEEVYALRAMIEAHAAERAAPRIGLDKIQRLRAICDEMEAAFRVGPKALAAVFQPLNGEFHQIVLEAAMSPRLKQMASLVIEWPLRMQTFSRYRREDLARSLGHHRELVSAFDARDPVWAGAVWRAHIHAALRALVRKNAAPGDQAA